MTPENFIYWLDGYLVDKDKLTEEDINKINIKLSNVFTKVTPYLNLSSNLFNPNTSYC
jgi:hypothetical protein